MAIDDIKLLPLRCPDCGMDIDSKEFDMVHFCSNCGTGFQISGSSFKKINVLYAKPEVDIKDKTVYYLPMWQMLASITMKNKYKLKKDEFPEEMLKNKKFMNVITDLFEDENSTKEMIFFVPAFGVTNRYQLMDHPGFQFTVDPPKLKSGSPVEMIGAQYSIEDAGELAKDMFLSIQAHTHSDVYGSEINYDFKRYRMTGIPFFEEKGMLVDGIKGFRIFKDSLKEWNEIKEQLNRGG